MWHATIVMVSDWLLGDELSHVEATEGVRIVFFWRDAPSINVEL